MIPTRFEDASSFTITVSRSLSLGMSFLPLRRRVLTHQSHERKCAESNAFPSLQNKSGHPFSLREPARGYVSVIAGGWGQILMTILRSDDHQPFQRSQSVATGRQIHRALWVMSLVLIAAVGCGPGPATTTQSPVKAQSDEVTIEVLESDSERGNNIDVSSLSENLDLTNEDIGQTAALETQPGNELVIEIQPMLDGSPAEGPWRSGAGSRNSDGKVHALVTSFETEECLLVSFEDQAASEWEEHPDEPDFNDVVLWIYPATSSGYDTSRCPDLSSVSR